MITSFSLLSPDPRDPRGDSSRRLCSPALGGLFPCLTLSLVRAQYAVLMGSPMTIDTERQNDLCILRCKGRFVAGPDLEYMQAKMQDIKRLTCSRVLIDLREVPYIGSMGIAFIVGIYTSVIKHGGHFVLAGAVPLVRQVFDLTGLSTVIPMAPDIATGLAALREPRARAGHVCV